MPYIGPCLACGGPPEEETPGCRNCAQRHRQRRLREKDSLGRRAHIVATYMLCNPGALDPYDALTCVVWPSDELAGIFASRKIRVDVRANCSGCGCYPNDYTRGCKTCGDRHRKRDRRQSESLAA